MANSETRGSLGRQYVEVGENLPIPDEVDWRNAPSQFKRYRGLPRFALGYQSADGSAGQDEAPCRLKPEQIGQLLSDSYGLSRQRWTAPDALRWIVGSRGGGANLSRYRGLMMNTLRPVPSGGARFPGELYVVSGPDDGIPAGVHHYDPAHHALVTLREGDWRSALAAGLSYPDGELPPLTILVSIFFWKNAFKYGELSYRLCSLDAGALIGQILAVAGRYRPRASLRYQFVDADLNRLLGLDPVRESVYAAITIGDEAVAADATVDAAAGSKADPVERSEAAIQTSGDTWTIDALPLPAQLHRASCLSDADSFVPEGSLNDITLSGVESRQSIPLPERRLNLLAGLRHRRSSMGYLQPGRLSLWQLAELLGTAGDGYANDIDTGSSSVRHTLPFCAINNVEELESGVYYYQPGRHTLEQVRAADVSAELQASLTTSLFNLAHAGLCVYPVADYDTGFDTYGDRWYRMQNMEAGIMLQRLYLAAAALGLGCQANLGYSVRRTNQLLGLDDGRMTSLIQLMIGTQREPGDYYEHACW